MILSLIIPSIHIYGDFNIQHKERLVRSVRNFEEGRYCHGFSIVDNLTQIVDKSARIRDIK